MSSRHASSENSFSESDTIVAVSTPPGKGGIGIIRFSGESASEIASRLTGRNVVPRKVLKRKFFDNRQRILDEGVVLYYQAPNSYTGEHVCEVQCHGGPVVVDLLLQRVIELGARLAEPGEFTRRAFLNDKLDLAQAESVADLINSSTSSAVLSASRSLQGEFSRRIHEIRDSLVQIRMYVEAAIDFPEEEIDFLADSELMRSVENVRKQMEILSEQVKKGRVLRDGVRVVLAGLPNAGKSSLLNRFAGEDRAIVTPQAGTTRDSIDVAVDLKGLPVLLTDTAGLCESDDIVESEGVKRAWSAIKQSDLVLYTVDNSKGLVKDDLQFLDSLGDSNVIVVWNKIDLNAPNAEKIQLDSTWESVSISAKTGQGVNQIYEQIQKVAGISFDEEGLFIARRRHVDAIRQTLDYVDNAQTVLAESKAGELAAQDLRDALDSLGKIVGHVTPDDLLGEIFSNFCIGK